MHGFYYSEKCTAFSLWEFVHTSTSVCYSIFQRAGCLRDTFFQIKCGLVFPTRNQSCTSTISLRFKSMQIQSLKMLKRQGLYYKKISTRSEVCNSALSLKQDLYFPKLFSADLKPLCTIDMTGKRKRSQILHITYMV